MSRNKINIDGICFVSEAVYQLEKAQSKRHWSDLVTRTLQRDSYAAGMAKAEAEVEDQGETIDVLKQEVERLRDEIATLEHKITFAGDMKVYFQDGNPYKLRMEGKYYPVCDTPPTPALRTVWVRKDEEWSPRYYYRCDEHGVVAEGSGHARIEFWNTAYEGIAEVRVWEEEKAPEPEWVYGVWEELNPLHIREGRYNAFKDGKRISFGYAHVIEECIVKFLSTEHTIKWNHEGTPIFGVRKIDPNDTENVFGYGGYYKGECLAGAGGFTAKESLQAVINMISARKLEDLPLQNKTKSE